MKDKKYQTYIMLMFFASFLWAFSGVFIRNISSFSSIGITLGRLFFAIIPLFIFILFSKKTRTQLFSSFKDLKIFIILGLVMSLIFICSVWGYTLTHLATAQALNSIGMFFTVLLAPIFLKEFVSRKDCFGMVITFFGIILILGIDSASLNKDFLKGDIVSLAASFCAAFYGILVRKYQLNYPFYINMFWIFVIAFIWVFLISQILQLPIIIDDVNTRSILNLIAFGILGTCVAHSILNKSFYVLRTEKALTISLFSVVFSYFLALFFFGETLNLLSIIGVVFVILGVYIVMRRHA